jgi:hypothetical protein
MRSAILKQNGLLLKLALALFVCVADFVSSELIILDFKRARATTGDLELKLCALKKPAANNAGASNNVPLSLIDLKLEDGCRPLIEPVDANFSQSAVYMHRPKTNCPFYKSIENLQVHNPELVLVGSDGPIVTFRLLLFIKI